MEEKKLFLSLFQRSYSEEYMWKLLRSKRYKSVKWNAEIKRHALRERVAGTSIEYNCFSNDLFVTDINCIKNSKLRFYEFY